MEDFSSFYSGGGCAHQSSRRPPGGVPWRTVAGMEQPETKTRLCLNCELRKPHRRGLCKRCHSNLSLRARYPHYLDDPDDFSGPAASAAAPLEGDPGDRERVESLAGRARQRQDLFRGRVPLPSGDGHLDGLSLAARLTVLRARRGWSVRELARRAGVDHSTVLDLEGGRFRPKLGTLEALAGALGESVAALLPGQTA